MKNLLKQMAFEDILILCFIFAFSGVVVSQRQEFCQSFANNNFTIDYGYQTDDWTNHFLVIGSNYWQIEWSEDRARLESGLSRTSDLLGKQFRTAFLTNFSSDENQMISMTGRLFRNNNTIDWSYIRFNKTMSQLTQLNAKTEHSIQSGRIDIQFDTDFESSVSLVASLGTICFVQQKPFLFGNTILFESTYRCFYFDYLGSSQRADNRVAENLKRQMDRKNITYESYDTILHNLWDTRQVLAVMSEPYHFSDIRYLFLFKDGKSINYCLSSFIDLTKGCETQPEVLISCSDYEPTTEPIEWIVKEISDLSSIWEILEKSHFHCVIAILLVFILIVIPILLWKTKSKKQQTLENFEL